MPVPRRSAPSLVLAARRHGEDTPTPPPVSVRVAHRASEPRLPAAPSRAARAFGWALVPALALGCIATAVAWRMLPVSQWIAPGMVARTSSAGAAVLERPADAAPSTSASSAVKDGGWRISHEGHVSLPGGVLLFPESFKPDADGYDLIIHFHGNVQIVKQSVEHARINAVLAVINLGVRSAVYHSHYEEGGSYERLMARIHAGLEKRGFPRPKLRRLAMTSWSAGYEAIESILEHRRAPHAEQDPLDAILCLDGVHASFIDGDPKRLNQRSVEPLVRVAQAAAAGDLLFVATHSDIDPGDYASAKRTQSYLLEQVGSRIQPSALLPMPDTVALPAAKGAVMVERRMIPTSITRVGSLVIKGYEGNTPDHHSAHLTQMAPIVLSDLAERWKH